MLNQIKNNSFVGWAAIFTVIFLAPNTYYVYHSFSVFDSPYREIASIGVALIIAASILIYTLRKNFKVAKYYTIFEVSISAYYYINTIGWDWGLIPALGFTLILPISVYYYSMEYDKDVDTEDYQKLYNDLRAEWSEHVDTYKHRTKMLNESQQECAHWISKYENEVQESATVIGLRDERIGELEALNKEVDERIEYLDNKIDERDKEIESLRDREDVSLKRVVVLNGTITSLQQQLSKYDSSLIPAPENVTKFEQAVVSVVDEKTVADEKTEATPISKPKAPIKRTRKQSDQKSTE